jgi:hypothetical protein
VFNINFNIKIMEIKLISAINNLILEFILINSKKLKLTKNELIE